MKNTVTAVLFVAFLAVGFVLADHKPLWNDEIHTQVSSVSAVSYAGMVSGRIGEGNANPLFYVIQKGVCDLGGYVTPKAWIAGQWGQRDPRSEILLRINPVVFMSMALAAIFYFFWRFYGPWPGWYSLGVALSSYMVWAYWAEARPYALWTFLTTVQTLLFLYIVEFKSSQRRVWTALALTHLALSLTVTVSILQILAVSLLLWIFRERRVTRYMWLTIIPLVTCVFYYLHAPKHQFWFSDSPLQLISASIPKDRMLIILGLGAVLSAHSLKTDRPLTRALSQSHTVFFGLTLLFLLAAGALLAYLKIQESPLHAGFSISNRYFIFLVPVGIIAVSLFSVKAVRLLKDNLWGQRALAVILILFLVFRVLRTMGLVRSFYSF